MHSPRNTKKVNLLYTLSEYSGSKQEIGTIDVSVTQACPTVMLWGETYCIAFYFVVIKQAPSKNGSNLWFSTSVWVEFRKAGLCGRHALIAVE